MNIKTINLLYILLAMLSLASCSKEEEVITPLIVQKPTPEPETVQYTVTVTTEEGGTVSTEGGTFDEGTEITITATPSEGYVFYGWDNNSIQNPLIIKVSENVTVSPKFISILEFFAERQCAIETLVPEMIKEYTFTPKALDRLIPLRFKVNY